MLADRRNDLRESDRPLIDQLAPAQDRPCPIASPRCSPRDIDLRDIRHHGDFHLAQMLIVKDDVFITDFEGEPAAAGANAGARRRRRATSPA